MSHDRTYCVCCQEAETDNAALRGRVADLEMMLRASHRFENERCLVRFGARPPWSWRIRRNLGSVWEVMDLDDDGAGLPLLTDEARSELMVTK